KVVLKNNAVITGTIVVDGDIYVEGSGINLTAVRGFPAVVCSGDIILDDKNIGMTVNGAVLVGGSIRAISDVRGGSMTVNGFLRVTQPISLTQSQDFDITVNL